MDFNRVFVWRSSEGRTSRRGKRSTFSVANMTSKMWTKIWEEECEWSGEIKTLMNSVQGMLQNSEVETRNMENPFKEFCSNMGQKNGMATRKGCEHKDIFILRWEMLYLVSMVIKIIQ